MSRRALILTAVAIALLAAGLGYWFGQRGMPNKAEAGEMPAPAADAAPLYWFDPMVPDQHFDKPGKSPFMDMMLVPRYADAGTGDTVAINPGLQQNLGIRTAVVELDSVATEIRAPGTLQWDLSGERRVAARVEGLVERVHVQTPFARVRQGQPLVTLLAPMLGGALAEYRALASGSSDGSRALLAAARSRLQLLGLTAADLQRPSAGGAPRIVLRAPANGVLGDIAVREGDTVTAGQLLMQVNATDTLWVEAQVPQVDVGTLSANLTAEVEVSGFPGERFEGVVDAVLPQVDPATRTQTVRIVVQNREEHLAAGQFATVVLRSDSERVCPWVPSEALILTGSEARVIVRDDDGGFRPVRVRAGRVVGERSEILEGLSGGEKVVVSGQFLIDSEASLSGLLGRLNAKPAARAEADEAGQGP